MLKVYNIFFVENKINHFQEKDSRNKNLNKKKDRVNVKLRGSKNNMCATLDLFKGKKAEDLIQEFDLDKELPVDLNALLEEYNVSVQPTDFEELKNFPDIADEINKKGNILGAVAINGDNLRILYRETDSVHRQKFTIAHEIAHCCLDTEALRKNGHIEYRKDREFSDSIKEKKANIFAGELLIPATALNKIYERVSNPVLKELAERFDVSENVMRARLKQLNFDFQEKVSINQLLNYSGSII